MTLANAGNAYMVTTFVISNHVLLEFSTQNI